jgi:hypothetical protein
VVEVLEAETLGARKPLVRAAPQGRETLAETELAQEPDRSGPAAVAVVLGLSAVHQVRQSLATAAMACLRYSLPARQPVTAAVAVAERARVQRAAAALVAAATAVLTLRVLMGRQTLAAVAAGLALARPPWPLEATAVAAWS